MLEPCPAMACAILEIDLGAIVANWHTLAARHSTGPVAGVVKADAYGLGARRVAPALYAAGCRHFFVAQMHEAVAIRDLVPDAMLAVLNGLVPGTEADCVAHDLTPVLGSLAEIDAWAARARAVGRRLPAILHIDTGMHRLGLSPREVATLGDDPRRLDGIAVRFVMSHLVSSEIGDDPLNLRQRDRFALARAGLPDAPSSFANSSGVFLGVGWGSDLARPGAALYGINPTPDRPNPMRPVLRLSARVLALRDVAVGEGVGYNATWHAGRPARIATAGIGYADGLHRALSNRGKAFFDGRPLPLVGRVSMDLTTFDATDHPGVAPGTWLEIVGPHQPADDLAVLCGTSGYEVLTSLGRRFARVYRPA
jgi:alanine racemase